MSRNDYTLDGVALFDPAGRWFPERSTGIRVYPARRSTNLMYPGVDGEVFNPGARFESGSVSINLYIEGSTHEEMMENIEFINGVIGQRHKALDLIHHYSTSQDRHAKVEFMESYEPKLYSPLKALLQLRASVLNTFWRSPVASDTTSGAIGTGLGVTDLINLSGGNAPVSDALIRVKGAFSELVLVDPVSGSTLQIKTPLTATQYIIIDTANWTARKVTTNTWEGGTVVDSLVVSNRGYGSMFEIAPSRYNSTSLNYQLQAKATNPSSSPVATVRAKKSYL